MLGAGRWPLIFGPVHCVGSAWIQDGEAYLRHQLVAVRDTLQKAIEEMAQVSQVMGAVVVGPFLGIVNPKPLFRDLRRR